MTGKGSEGIFPVLMKDAPLAALDPEALSLLKEHTGTDQRQNNTHSHQPAWLGRPPAKVPLTLT